MREYGTNVVGGVTPGKGGLVHEGVPVFDTVQDAVKKTGANASVIFVPPPVAADAILEAVDAGIELVVCITEGIPVLDMVKVRRALGERTARRSSSIGPNCPGIITPGECKIGIMPGYIHKPGGDRRGVALGHADLRSACISSPRSASASRPRRHRRRSGQGARLRRRARAVRARPETRAVLMIGEIGGTPRRTRRASSKSHMKKPVAAFIAGQTAPPGKRMGHAGAIISGGKGTAAEKIAALRDAGIAIAATPADMGKTVAAFVS